jgi:hypothetical protein
MAAELIYGISGSDAAHSIAGFGGAELGIASSTTEAFPDPPLSGSGTILEELNT